MKKNNEAKTEFNIYKIDNEKIVAGTGLDLSKPDLLLDALCDFIKNGNGEKDFIAEYQNNGFRIFLFEKRRDVKWAKAISDLIGTELNYLNVNYAYLLFRIVKDSIFVVCGGCSKYYIGDYIIPQYGKNVLPKISNKDDKIIKNISKEIFQSNEAKSSVLHKDCTSVRNEKNLNSITRNMNVFVGNEILSYIGYEIEEDSKCSMKLGDGLVINRFISTNELINLLNQLWEIEKLKPNYVMDPLIPIKNAGISANYVKDLFAEKFESMVTSIGVTADLEYINYNYIISMRTIEYNGNTKIIDNEIKFSDIYMHMLENRKGEIISKTYIYEYLKHSYINFYGENGVFLFKSKIWDIIDVELCDETKNYYLKSGKWLVFDDDLVTELNEQFDSFYKENERKLQEVTVLQKYGIIGTSKSNEKEYNESFINNCNVLYTDRKQICKIELCDLIFYDDEHLYLMCNKVSMNGQHTRDLGYQIKCSQSILSQSKARNPKFKDEYYDSLDLSQQNKISRQDFNKLFDKKIVYIMGFGENFKVNNKSVYAKYIINDLEQYSNNYFYDLLVLNYS